MLNALRSRAALFALLGAFLIPLGESSLSGLTHVLTCREDARAPFTIVIPQSGAPQIQSSVKIRPGERELCGGLSLDTRVGAAGSGRVRMIISITNRTDFRWRGSVQILVGSTSFPANIGEIGPRSTATDEVLLRLEPGTHELEGSLLIGP